MLIFQCLNISAMASQAATPPLLPDDGDNPFRKVMSSTPWGGANDRDGIAIGETKEGKPNLVWKEKFGTRRTRSTTFYIATYGTNGYFTSDNIPTYTLKTRNGYYWYGRSDAEVVGKSSRQYDYRDEWFFTEGTYGGLNIWNAKWGPNALLLVEGSSYYTTGGMFEVNRSTLDYTYNCMYDATGDFFRSARYTNIYLGLNAASGYISNQSAKTNNVYLTMTEEDTYDCPKTISFEKTSQTMNVGAEDVFTNNMHSLWSYSISDENVISFESTTTGFKIIAKRAGTSVFTFKNKFSGASASITYTVRSSDVLPTYISLNKTSINDIRRSSNNGYQLTATISPSNATNKSVSWSSSNTSVATVSSTGYVTCKAPGYATITCTSNAASSVKATCSVSVTQAVTSITLSGSSSMQKGNTQTLTYTVSPTNASNKNVTFTSSNTSVATVSSYGYVTAKAAGTAVITCKAADGYGASATKTITVTDPTPTDLDMVWTSVTTSNNLSNMKQSDNLSFSGTLKNNAGTGVYVKTAICITDLQGNNLIAKSSPVEKYYAAYSSVTTSHTMSLSEVPEGNYKVSVMYYDPNNNKWWYTNAYLYDITITSIPNPNTGCYLTANSTTILKGNKVEVPIYMNNSTSITSFQFDMYLPSGVTVATDNYGDYEIFISNDRTNERQHTVSAARQNDGAIRVLCYSPTNKNFSGSSGKVLTINLTTTSSASSGTYNAYLKGQILSTVNLDAYKPNDKSFSITVKNYMPGDVNGDGVVTVVDVTAAVSLALGGGSSNLVREAADINGDGAVTVVDVTGIVNIVLTGSSRTLNAMFSDYGVERCECLDSKRKMEAPEPGTIAVYIDDCVIDPGQEKELAILMNNPNDAFTGIQFDMYLPEGLSIVREDDFAIIDIGSRSSSRRHTVSSATQPDGAERVLAYSNSNYTFNGESGDILIVTVKADANFNGGQLALKNIILSRPDVTGYDAPEYTANISTTAGIESLTTDEMEGASIFDLSGRKIDSNANRKGIVIQRARNGKTIKIIR